MKHRFDPRNSQLKLAENEKWWDSPTMTSVKCDDKGRIRMPDGKPGDIFAWERDGDGSLRFIKLKAEAHEPFPPGSLKKYFTAARDREELALLRGCVLEAPE